MDNGYEGGISVKPIFDLMKQINSKTVPHYNIFFGEEIAVMKIYQQKVLDIGYRPVYCDTVQQAVSMATKKTLDNSTKCFIVQDDLDYQKQDKIWQKVENIFNKSSHIIILKYSTLDKRKAFYKHHEANLVYFEKLSEEVLSKHIKTALQGKANEDTINNIINICENDYNRILLECDKILKYAKVSGRSVDESFNTLVEQNIIYQPIGDITFKITDSILLRDYNNVYKFIYLAKLKQEPAILVLSVLYDGFKQILMVQGLGSDRTNAAKRTGLTPWQVKQAMEKMGAYSLKELVSAMDTIRDIEQGIKTGTIDDDVALDCAVLNIL